MRSLCCPYLLALSASAWAGNFATCILDKMPGSSNQATNAAVWQSCSAEFPSRYTGIEQGSGRSLFGFKDGNACTIKKAAGTTFPMSANAIAVACRCLYNEPNPFEKTDPQDKRPVMCDYPRASFGVQNIPFDPSTARPSK